MSKERIGVFGSALSGSEAIVIKARELGIVLADYNVVLIVGACPGLPYETALAAYQKNKTEIWGYSPVINRRISKPSKAVIYFNQSPQKLVQQVVKEIQSRLQ